MPETTARKSISPRLNPHYTARMEVTGTNPTRRIAMINQKGGVGKTTTTVNVAAALAQMNQRVLVLDLDPQAHATLHLGVDTDEHLGTIYDLLCDPQLDPGAVISKARTNLDIIASETDLAAVEGELASHADRNTRIRRVLEPISGDYDYILFDCPPSLGILTINALAAATEVIIPMQAHFLALQGVGKLLETIELITQHINPSLCVSGVVLCAHDLQASHAQEVVDDLKAFFESARGTGKPWSNGRVFEPPVRRNIKLAESPSFGQTIFDYAPTAAGAKDYSALAVSIAAVIPGTTLPSPQESVPSVDPDLPLDDGSPAVVDPPVNADSSATADPTVVADPPVVEVRVAPTVETRASDECATPS